ncbi:hypothetical protein K504DRAFT_371243, partial [Pleomassaria siparia CBS 279.74]
IEEHLLPTLRATYRGRLIVIILNNISIYINSKITETIKRAGYIVRYLLPYLPNYNLIKLTFRVLKAFSNFLKDLVRESRCNRFIRKHFKHAARGLYIEQEELNAACKELRGNINAF